MSLSRWSEDETVGRMLIVAGVVVLVIQIVPYGLFRVITKLWPLAILVVGVALLVGTRRRAGSS
jgi:hypothetical protein